MTHEIAFDGEVISARGGGHAIRVDESLAGSIGAKHLSRVAGTLNGRPFRSNLMQMGNDMFLGVHKANIDALGTRFGQTIAVVMSLDSEPREGDTPPTILVDALRQDPIAAEAWENLAPPRRREIVRSINEAKKEETRDLRVGRTIAELAGRDPTA